MQENTFEDELWAQIRKDFGDHLMRHREFQKARENFEESLQFQPDKLDSVYRLASSQAREAKVDDALINLKSRSRLGEFFDYEGGDEKN
jgi:predicted negative regulator of RcsB-dependent stress response